MADASISATVSNDEAGNPLGDNERLVDLGAAAKATTADEQSSANMDNEKLNSLLNESEPGPAAVPGAIGEGNLPQATDPVGLGDFAAADNISGGLDSQPAAPGGQFESLGAEENIFPNEPLPLNNAGGNNAAGFHVQQTELGNGVLDMHTIKNIKVNVQAVLGGISMSVSKLANLKEGELVSLEKKIGDEIEILANGQLIAHGEIVVIEGDVPKFGITLTEIVESGIRE